MTDLGCHSKTLQSRYLMLFCQLMSIMYWATLRHAIVALDDRVCCHQVPSETESQLTNDDLACMQQMILTTDVSVIR